MKNCIYEKWTIHVDVYSGHASSYTPTEKEKEMGYILSREINSSLADSARCFSLENVTLELPHAVIRK